MKDMKSYTDIEQSKKLAEILPIESADMKWFFWKDEIVKLPTFGYSKESAEFYKGTEAVYLPCWSLTALFDVLRTFTTPTAFSVKVSVPSLIKTQNGYKLTYVGDYTPMINNELNVEAPIESVADNPIDVCVDMIIKLNGVNLL